MRHLLNELRTIYAIDFLRFRSRLFLFLFNVFPDLYAFRVIKNILLKLAGVKIHALQTYIRNNLYFDNSSSLIFGNGIFINRNVYFEGMGKVLVGNSVQIGPNVSFFTTNHKCHEKDETINIIVGDNVWIGGGCIILPGTKIGSNVSIAAGSIVKGEIDGGILWAGSPAIKKR